MNLEPNREKPLELPHIAKSERRPAVSSVATHVIDPLSTTDAREVAGGGTEAATAAILEELYAERRAYLTKQRLGHLTSHEQQYLRDIDREIDKLEAPQGSLRDGELWSQIDALASRIVARVNVQR